MHQPRDPYPYLEPRNERRIPGSVVAPDFVNDLLHGDVVAEVERVDPRVDGHQTDERVRLALHVHRHALAGKRLSPGKQQQFN